MKRIQLARELANAMQSPAKQRLFDRHYLSMSAQTERFRHDLRRPENQKAPEERYSTGVPSGRHFPSQALNLERSGNLGRMKPQSLRRQTPARALNSPAAQSTPPIQHRPQS